VTCWPAIEAQNNGDGDPSQIVYFERRVAGTSMNLTGDIGSIDRDSFAGE
jgi:hypothetical protein